MNVLLETDRLLLRPFQIEDAACFYNMNNDKEVMQFTGDVPFEDKDATVRFIMKYHDDPESQYVKYNMGRLTVVRKSDQRAMGWAGLKYHEKEQVVDLGYRLEKRSWGQGYATEAARRCLQHAFEDHQLKEVVANVHEQNIGSHKVAERVGMTIAYRYLWDGKLPARYYRILKVK